MFKRFAKNEKGQAMVEFALITPLLILLLCGIIDFGWIFGNQLILNNASRDTARFMAINYNDTTKTGNIESDKDTAARTAFLNRLGSYTHLTGTNLLVDSTKITGTEVSVKIVASYPLPFLTPFLSTLYKTKTILIKTETTMRLE